MRRALLIWCLLLAGIICIAQSEHVNAFWQSRDSNYNDACTITGTCTGGGSTTTFDPVNIGANMVLSGGNLTATNTTNDGYSLARSLTSHSSGKYYAEFLGTFFAGNVSAVGIANSSLSTDAGFDANLSGADFVGATDFYINSTMVGTGAAAADGTVIAIALDAGGQLFWMSNIVSGTRGNWNGSALANPATGVGGISIAAITGPYFAEIWSNGASGGSIVTANFGGSAYAATPPIGFGNW